MALISYLILCILCTICYKPNWNKSLIIIIIIIIIVTGGEKVFYEDEKGERKFRISEEIDSDCVAQKEIGISDNGCRGC